MERLAEVLSHFGLPLPYQPLGRNNEDALGAAAQLQLAQYQACLDSLPQPNFVSKKVADAVLPNGAIERV